MQSSVTFVGVGRAVVAEICTDYQVLISSKIALGAVDIKLVFLCVCGMCREII
jgi:hypothetical protein